MKKDDVQLIRITLSGDDAAFSTLVQKYRKSVHALAWRKIGDFHYAEEITQDTFLQAYKKLSTLKELRQVRLARELTQISPIVCFQYAMEGLANTGIVSYMNFVKQVRRYRQTFIDFIKTEDKSNPDSFHVYPVREGLSQKPVDPDAIPRFEEQVSYQSVLFPVGLLILFNALFFTAAQLSFLKCDLK